MDFEHGDESEKSVVLSQTFTTTAAKKNSLAISGVAIVKGKLFISTFSTSEIEIHDLETLALDDTLHLSFLVNAYDMKYCNINNCLYVMDDKFMRSPCEICIVTLEGKLINSWTIGMGYGCISVTFDANALLATYNEGRIEEYTPDGASIESFFLSSEKGFPHARYAIKLLNHRYLISHGEGDDPIHRVCIVDRTGNVFAAFGGERGSSIAQLNVPVFLELDSTGSIVVLDRDNSRVLLLDSEKLTLKKELISKGDHGMHRPERLAIDASRGRIFVAHNDSCWNECRIFVLEQCCISQTETDSSSSKQFNQVINAKSLLSIGKSIAKYKTVLIDSLDVSSILLADLVGNKLMDERKRQHILSAGTRCDVNGNFLNWLDECLAKTVDIHAVMEILRADDQEHIVNLIEGNQGELPLSPLTRNRLFSIIRWLAENMNVDYGVLEYMLSEGAINRRHRDAILAKATDSEKILELIEIVSRRSDSTLDCLLIGLEKTGQEHITCRIQKALHGLFVLENPSSVAPLLQRDFVDGGEKIVGSSTSVVTRAISGIAIVDQELFFTNFKSSEIGIYNITTLAFIRSFTITDLVNPYDMKYCGKNRCLYIMDSRYSNSLKCMLRLTSSGELIKSWSTESRYGCISVTFDSNVLLASFEEGRIAEFSPDGDFIREIVFPSGTRFSGPRYAIKLTDDRFLTSHGEGDDKLHTVCIIDAEGNIKVSSGGKKGSANNRFNVPIYLTIDSRGSIIVIDRDNSRVLSLEPNYLDFKQELISSGRDGMVRPERMALDESRGKIFIAHNDAYWSDCCVFVFEYQ